MRPITHCKRNCYGTMTVLLRKSGFGKLQRAGMASGLPGRSATRKARMPRRCRDFAHLAVTLSRCMNIPARYCTGYLGDIGVPIDPASMDFSAWHEVFLDGRWFTLDARHNHPRIRRIVIAKGRDAAVSRSRPPSVRRNWHNVITEELAQADQNVPLRDAA